MIRGLGVDVVEIARMERAVEKWGREFLERIFTEKELAYAASKQKPPQHYAARFAVKEAVAKALGTGWSAGFRWKDIEVENDTAGRPDVLLHGAVKERVGGAKVHVSISHGEAVVVAVAVLEV